MNKKAVAFLLPLYFVALLALMGLLIFAVDYEVTDDTPRLGETPNAVLDAYAQEDALKIYAQQAARIATQEAARTSTLEDVEDKAKKRYTQLLRNHPTNPITVPVTVERTTDTLLFTSEQDVVIPISYGEEAATIKTTGTFTHWPLPLSANPYQLSSVFGKRDLNGVEGSSNHPGIDLPAADGTPVLAVASGEIVKVRQDSHYLYIRTDTGWTCGYFHIEPTVDVGDTIAAGEQVARITQDSDYGLHVDLRCFSHQLELDASQAASIFGDGHVSTSSSQPEDTAYAALSTGVSRQEVFLDPYCLFSPEAQQSVAAYYRDNPAYLLTVSGLSESRREGETTADRLSETCDAYAQAGVVTRRQAEITDSFVDTLIDDILITEGEACVLEPNGEYSKYGVTQRAYQEHYGEPAGQVTICSLQASQARDIYAQRYLYGPGFDRLPAQIIPAVFDSGVNQGPADAKAFLSDVLQEAGILDGPTEDIDELAAASAQALRAGIDVNDRYADRRIQDYRQLARDPDYAQYLDGWIARTEKYRSPADIDRYVSNAELRGIGSYQFSLDVAVTIPGDELRSLRQRDDHRYTFEACMISDRACINNQLRYNAPGYGLCTDYAQQLRSIISSCAQAIESGCSCYVPLPDERFVSLTNTTFFYDGQEYTADWTLDNPETPPRIWLAVENTAYDSVAYSPSLPGELVADNETILAVDEQNVWLRMDVENDNVILSFSARNATQACGYEVPETYCADDESFTAQHRIR